MEYRLVLGLEIHMHVKTSHGMFCGCSSDIYGVEPNTRVCPVCLGLPGALPVPNYDAIEKTQLLGLALSCQLNEHSRFDRKHYFYPDLPKGYQISQYKQPLCGEGFLLLDSGKKIEIERIHLEEDTAKSFHEGPKTLIDFNKSGAALAELVTKPVFTNVEDAVEFCKKLQDIVRFLGICDADMEKGQMRLEANISLRTPEMEELEELPKYKVEIKNINSFRFMERAVKAEIVRQTALLEKGEQPIQENRGFNEFKGITVPQRSKEEAHDYRYFPEPDIPPMVFTKAHFDKLESMLPELPVERKKKLIEKHGLPVSTASVLSTGENMDLYAKFMELVALGTDSIKAGNSLVNKKEFRNMPVSDIKAILDIAGEKVSDLSELDDIVKSVLDANSDAVVSFKSGKDSALQFLIGQVMRETKGKADSLAVKELLEKHLH